MHSHSDRLIESCPVCQKNIKEIQESGKEMDRLGIWNFPEKWEKGKEYDIWKKKEEVVDA